MYNHDLDKPKLDLTFTGFYRGVVLDTNDPLKAGRAKVRIFSVYDDVQEAAIPWAEYADAFFSKGMFLPDVGDTVWCFFDNGSHMNPIFFAGAQSAKQFPSETSTGDGVVYSKNRVIKLKGGHKIEMDDSGGGRINISHNSGSRLTMLSSGDIEIVAAANLTQTVGGNMVTNVTGSSTTNVTGSSTINANSITAAASSAVTVTGSTISLN
jgi:hypothetical protein